MITSFKSMQHGNNTTIFMVINSNFLFKRLDECWQFENRVDHQQRNVEPALPTDPARRTEDLAMEPAREQVDPALKARLELASTADDCAKADEDPPIVVMFCL